MADNALARASGAIPDASIYAGQKLANPFEDYSQAVQVARQVNGLQADQFALAQKKLGAMKDAFSSVLLDPTDDNIQQRAADLKALGIADADIQRGLGEINQSPNPDARKKIASRYLFSLSSVQEKLQQSGMAAPEIINNGGQQIPITRGSGINSGIAQAPGGVINNTLTPGDASAITTVPDPRDPTRQVTGTKGQVLRQIGDTNALPPQRPAAPLVPQGAASAGGIVSASPGDVEAGKTTGVASAQQGIDLQKQADGVPVRKGMLAQLETDLDKFTSGPGADWQGVAKAWANRNVLPQGMQFDPKSIAGQEAFTKQATQLATQQFAAIGGTGTDEKLGAAFKSNPNTALSDLGNRQIIQLLKGNEDAIAAKNLAWQKWQQQNGASSYGRFSSEFNKVYSPLVFQTQYMNPEEIKGLRDKLKGKDLERFKQSYTVAKENGWLNGGQDGR